MNGQIFSSKLYHDLKAFSDSQHQRTRSKLTESNYRLDDCTTTASTRPPRPGGVPAGLVHVGHHSSKLAVDFQVQVIVGRAVQETLAVFSTVFNCFVGHEACHEGRLQTRNTSGIGGNLKMVSVQVRKDQVEQTELGFTADDVR